MKFLHSVDLFRGGMTLLLLVACGDPDDETKPEDLDALNAFAEVVGYDVGNEGNASDIRVFITTGPDRDLVEEYRIFVIDEGRIITESMAVNSENYVAIQSSVETIKINLKEDLIQVNGEVLENGSSYVVQVLAITNESNYKSTLSSRSEPFELTNGRLSDLYVSSRNTNSVELFDGVTGEYITSFVESGAGGLSAPQDLNFLRNGNLIVTGRGNTAVKEYDPDGNYVGDFTTGYLLDNPTKMNFGPGNKLYISQWGTTDNSIVRFNDDGNYDRTVVQNFGEGMDHAWDTDGNMYVIGFDIRELRVYDPEFNLLQTMASNLTGPVNLWLKGSSVFIADWSEGVVKEFSSSLDYNGNFITGLNNVEGFAFDENGDILLCDWWRNEIKVFDSSTGSLVRTLVSSSIIQQPNALVLGPNRSAEDVY